MAMHDRGGVLKFNLCQTLSSMFRNEYRISGGLFSADMQLVISEYCIILGISNSNRLLDLSVGEMVTSYKISNRLVV